MERLKAICDYLKADADVALVIGARAYVEEIPDNVLPRMPMACLVVLAAGGGYHIGGRSNAEYSDTRIDIRHYAYTPVAARSLYTLVFSKLKHMPRKKIGDTLIHWCNPSSGPIQMREPAIFNTSKISGERALGAPRSGSAPPDNTVEWPFVVSSWQILAAEIPV